MRVAKLQLNAKSLYKKTLYNNGKVSYLQTNRIQWTEGHAASALC